MSRSTGFDERTRQIILERDLFRCCRCGTYVGPFGDFEIHHRRPRGMGGSKDPATNQPANGLTLCRDCHRWAEAKRLLALSQGFLVPQGTDPATVPVDTYRGRLLLDNDGGFTEAAREDHR